MKSRIASALRRVADRLDPRPVPATSAPVSYYAWTLTPPTVATTPGYWCSNCSTLVPYGTSHTCDGMTVTLRNTAASAQR